MMVCDKGILKKEVTDTLKGIMAIMVIITHLRAGIEALNDTAIGSLLTTFGYIAVSGFFFLSGYGLMEQYTQKGAKYARNFGRKIFSYYAVYLLFYIIYIARNLLMGITLNYTALFRGLTFGTMVVDNGWYLQAQLLLYFAFWGMTMVNRKMQPVFITGGVHLHRTLLHHGTE